MFTTLPFIQNYIPQQIQQPQPLQQPPPYYGIKLLDDLHHFFPALLYEPEIFLTVNDVLSYIRDMSSRHFNIFNRAAENYRRTVNTNTSTIPTIRFTNAAMPTTTATPSAVRPQQQQQPFWQQATQALFSEPRPYAVFPQQQQQPQQQRDASVRAAVRPTNILSHLFEYDEEFSREIDSLISDFMPLRGHNAAILGTATFTLPTSFTEPVPIIATRQQINRGTRVFRFTDTSGQLCTICHENINNKIVRKIHACNHIFHKNCIDRWFRQNVTCPVCRHDIRDRVTDNSVETTTQETLSHESNSVNVD